LIQQLYQWRFFEEKSEKLSELKGKQLDAKINKIKSEIFKIDALRPGSLAQQFTVCGVAGCRCKDKKNFLNEK
jgi:hypothetical protein